MGKPGVKDPTVSTSTQLLRSAFSGHSFGVVGAAMTSRVCLKLLREGRLPRIPLLPEPSGSKSGMVVAVATAAALGYSLGHSTMSAVQWLRFRAIKALLAYNGWMFNQKATSTKVRAFIKYF